MVTGWSAKSSASTYDSGETLLAITNAGHMVRYHMDMCGCEEGIKLRTRNCIIHIKNPTRYNSVSIFFFSYLYETQHVSGDTSPSIRSLKLH